MACKIPEIELTLKLFSKVEQEIRSVFERIIDKLSQIRDQLLGQVSQMKLEYLNQEEARKKQVEELEEIIGRLDEVRPRQNTIINLHEDHRKHLNDELKKFQQPTPIPVPVFRTEALQSLLQQLEEIGALQDVIKLYSDKQNPVRGFSKKGKKRGEIEGPLGLCLDQENRLFIADNNSRVQVFSNVGKFQAEFEKGHLDRPHSIAIYDQWAFVTNWGFYSLLKFKICSFKLVSKGLEGGLNCPRGLAVDEKGDELFVADCINQRIAVFTSGLQYTGEIGKSLLKYPCDVKLHNDRMFVIDKCKPHNVHVFSRADLLYSMISLKVGTGNLFMSFDQHSNIVISDSKDNSIHILSIEGQLIHSIGCEGSPMGIAVTQDNTIVCAMFTPEDVVKFY